jgi:ABC-type sugar transport system permease subunit
MDITTTKWNGRTKPRSSHSWVIEQKIVPYLFIAPFFVTFFLFFLGPALFAIYASFHNWSLLGGMEFIGFKNFLVLFQDTTFWQSFLNTVVYNLAGLLIQWPLALILAVILNQKFLAGKKFFRPVFFIPVLTSSVVVAIMFTLFLDKDYGLFNVPLLSLGLKPINWLGSREMSKFAVILLLAWRWTGYNMVLFIAGLQAIPQDLYEAAWVDGASKIKSFVYITLPLLRPTIAYVMIMGFIGGWQLFDEPWILTKGGPADSSLSLGNFLYRVSIQNLRMGYGSALGVFLFLLLFGLTLIQMRFFNINREAEA